MNSLKPVLSSVPRRGAAVPSSLTASKSCRREERYPTNCSSFFHLTTSRWEAILHLAVVLVVLWDCAVILPCNLLAIHTVNCLLRRKQR